MWIGLVEPTADEFDLLAEGFELPELAIEDAIRAHQRPKLEQYGDALFVVARTAQMLDGRITFGETHLFIGHGYVVSVRHGASTSYTPVRERCEAAQKAFSEGEDFILYAILDFIVDNYVPVIEMIQAEVEGIEIYRGESDTPAEFTTRWVQCGTVVVWTRRGFRERG